MTVINTKFWPKVKPYLIALLIFVWFGMVIFAVRKNPSSADTYTHFVVMKEDMAALMKLGGKQIKVSENSKYGSAILIHTMHDEGWSDILVGRYENELLARGWRKLEKESRTFCKSGGKAKIVGNAGVVDGHGVNIVSMIYDSSTIEDCAK